MLLNKKMFERLRGLTWGEGHPVIENHSEGGGCINQDCGGYGKEKSDWREDCIGIKFAPSERPGKPFAAVCECDLCHGTYWFHVSEDFARLAKQGREYGKFPKGD